MSRIEVRFGNEDRLVGYWSGGPKMRIMEEVEFTSSISSEMPCTTYRDITFDVKIMKHTFSRHIIEDLGYSGSFEAEVRRYVPDYANQFEDTERMERVFTWDVYVPRSLEDFEVIFGSDHFEPV